MDNGKGMCSFPMVDPFLRSSRQLMKLQLYTAKYMLVRECVYVCMVHVFTSPVNAVPSRTKADEVLLDIPVTSHF